jgi:hypothetical protein
MVLLGLVSDFVTACHAHQVVAAPAAHGAIFEHGVFCRFVVVGVVAAGTGRIEAGQVLHAMNALFLGLVAHGAHVGLLRREQHLVAARVDVVAGDTGQVIEHVQGIFPVDGDILLVTGQASDILVSRRGGPAGAEAYVRRHLGGSLGVVVAGAMASGAAALVGGAAGVTAVRTLHQLVCRRFGPEIMAGQALLLGGDGRDTDHRQSCED